MTTPNIDKIEARAREIVTELEAGHPQFKDIPDAELLPWQREVVSMWALNLQSCLSAYVPALLAEIDRLRAPAGLPAALEPEVLYWFSKHPNPGPDDDGRLVGPFLTREDAGRDAADCGLDHEFVSLSFTQVIEHLLANDVNNVFRDISIWSGSRLLISPNQWFDWTADWFNRVRVALNEHGHRFVPSPGLGGYVR